MKTISLKIDDSLLKEIDGSLKKYRYSTRTEFIRDSIRTKLTQAEKEEMYRHLDTFPRKKGRNLSDEEMHKIGEKAFDELERKFMKKEYPQEFSQ